MRKLAVIIGVFGVVAGSTVLAENNSSLAPLTSAERQCPNATTFLSKTMGEAKHMMNVEFSSNWGINGPLCSTDYSNLTTRPLTGLCIKPMAIDQVSVYGAGNEAIVTGVTYILAGKVGSDAVHKFVSEVTGKEFSDTKDIPVVVAPLLRRKKPNQFGWINEREQLFAHAHQEDNPDQTVVVIFDLKSISAQLNEFNQCLRDYGFLE
jgi:hypothetical protein